MRIHENTWGYMRMHEVTWECILICWYSAWIFVGMKLFFAAMGLVGVVWRGDLGVVWSSGLGVVWIEIIRTQVEKCSMFFREKAEVTAYSIFWVWTLTANVRRSHRMRVCCVAARDHAPACYENCRESGTTERHFDPLCTWTVVPAAMIITTFLFLRTLTIAFGISMVDSSESLLTAGLYAAGWQTHTRRNKLNKRNNSYTASEVD